MKALNLRDGSAIMGDMHSSFRLISLFIFSLFSLFLFACGEDESPPRSTGGDEELSESDEIFFESSESEMESEEETPQWGEHGYCNCAEHACLSVAPRSISICGSINDKINKHFQIRNDGAKPFQLLDMRIKYDNNSSYSPDPNGDGKNQLRWETVPEFPFVIAPGESHTFGITFEPEDEYSIRVSAWIEILTDIDFCDMETSTVMIDSDGCLAPSAICHEPESIDFGEVPRNSDDISATITLRSIERNTRSKPIEIHSIMIENDDDLPFGESNAASAVYLRFFNHDEEYGNYPPIQSGEEWQFEIVASPLDDAPFSGIIVIRHNADYRCTTHDGEGSFYDDYITSDDIRITFTGRPIEACFSHTGPVIFEGVQVGEQAEKTLYLGARQDYICQLPVQIISCQLDGDDFGFFELVNANDICPTVIPIGEQRELVIRFSPMQIGRYSEIISFTTNDPCRYFYVRIHGLAIE